MQKVRPLFQNVLIKPLEEKKTQGSILLPETKNQNEEIEGEVIAVGKGDILPVAVTRVGGLLDLGRQPVEVPIGSHVIFKKFAGTLIKPDGQPHYLVHQKDCLAIIEYE